MTNPKRGLLAVTAVAAVAALLPFAAGAQDDSPIDLLRATMTAPARVSYVGEVQTLRIGEQRSEAAIYRVEHRAPSLTQRWYLAPQALYGDSVIYRGDQSYSCDVKRNRVIVSRGNGNDPIAQNDNFGLLAANYRALAVPDDSIDGRRARVIVLVNRFTGQPTMRVWIDDKTKLLLEKEQFAADGSVVAEIRFSRIRYTSAIPDQVFDVPKNLTRVAGPNRGTPSSDYTRIVRTAGFQARSPKYLPDGFFAAAGNVIEIKGVRTLHLLYSDGIRTVSLFENARGAAVDLSRYKASPARVHDHDAAFVEVGPTTLLAWSEENLHLALVGDLDQSEMQKIASSVAP